MSLDLPRAPAPSILYPVSNIDWRFFSYMIVYMFQCHSPKSSHPLLLPQSPKDCSIHLCLFCCLAYRVIVTIFLNSIYMLKLEPIIQSEVSQKEKHQYSILRIYMEFRKMVTITLYVRQQKRHRCLEWTFGLCGRGRGWGDLGKWH